MYPSEVTGMVLIDSTHEQQTKRFEELQSAAAAPALTTHQASEAQAQDKEGHSGSGWSLTWQNRR
jgi:hypothetical protein